MGRRWASGTAMTIALTLAAAPVARAGGAAAAFKVLTVGEAASADPAVLAPWPGGPPGLVVVAGLQDADLEGEDDTLGTLRVGVLARRGAGWAVVAADAADSAPEPKRSATLTIPDVSIDPAVFRISPDEVAIGVDVNERFATTATEYASTRLWLFRRVGSRLTPVLDAETETRVVDKTSPKQPEDDARHVLRISPHLTHGFHDLVLARPGKAAGRRYVWTGVRYARAR